MVACRTTDARYAATALGRPGTLLRGGTSGSCVADTNNQIIYTATTANAAMQPSRNLAAAASSGQVPLNK